MCRVQERTAVLRCFAFFASFGCDLPARAAAIIFFLSCMVPGDTGGLVLSRVALVSPVPPMPARLGTTAGPPSTSLQLPPPLLFAVSSRASLLPSP